MPDFLLYDQQGAIVTLTMNQPEQRNPLTGNTAVAEFLAAIDRIQDDPDVRCVILAANGPSFSAGGDIREMKRQATPEVSEMSPAPANAGSHGVCSRPTSSRRLHSWSRVARHKALNRS